MFVSSGQFSIFLACIAFGAVSGILFALSNVLKSKIKVSYLKIMLDVALFVFDALLFILYSNILNFPSIRAYMLLGVFIGVVCYIKSFNIMLAKSGRKLYNIFIRNKRKRKDRGYDRKQV